MYESPRPRSRSDAPRSANANDRIRLSIPKDHVSSTASSVGPSIYDFELAAPSPQRRVLPQLLVNNENRSTSHINNAAFSENSSIIGNGLQFTSSEDMATSPPHMLYPTRTQPHPRANSQEVSRSIHARNNPSYGSEDRRGTPGGVMLPRETTVGERAPGIPQMQQMYGQSSNVNSGLRARNGSLDSTTLGMDVLQIKKCSPENLHSQAMVIDRGHLARLSLDSNNLQGNSNFAHMSYYGNSNVSSPESHVSSKSFGTQPDGQSASQTGISPNRMRAKLLAQAIRDGRAEEPSRNGHAQYNQQERQSSIPSTPHSGHMNTTSVTGAMNAEVVPAMIALDPLIQKWKCKGGPTLSEAFDNLPFTERCRTTGPVNWGVIKIMDVSSCSNSAFDPIAHRN